MFKGLFSLSRCGGIGIHVGFRFRCCKAYGFESRQRDQNNPTPTEVGVLCGADEWRGLA